MANANDRTHFEDYREQTRVKHEILAAYLPAYFRILKGYNKNLLYIDAFAGPGRYTKSATGESIDGSPLLALKLIAEREFSDNVASIFIECDGLLYSQLEDIVATFYRDHPHIKKPVTEHGTFADKIRSLLMQVPNLAPTFLFVDPCGVEGASFGATKRIMDCDKCEAFIFFNIDGVRRIAGLEKTSPVLIDLMGSEKRATDLWEELRITAKPSEKEDLILTRYREAIRDNMGVKFTIPFRVEYEDRRATSHFLLHATKHQLGFKIMKDVMWKRGHSDEGAEAMEFVQASKINYVPMFDLRFDKVNEQILASLAGGPRKVDFFYFDLVYQPGNLKSEPEYKAALLKLEAEKKIKVLDKDGITPKPAQDRRIYNKMPTLGKGHYVALA